MSFAYKGVCYSDRHIRGLIEVNVNQVRASFEHRVHVSNKNLSYADLGQSSIYTTPMSIIISKKAVHDSIHNQDVQGLTSVLVALYHEAEHVAQEYDDRSEDNFSLSHIYSKLARYGNDELYYQNYYYNINELDAEISGIVSTYDALSMEFGQENAEQIMLDFINDKYREGKLYFGKSIVHESKHFDTYNDAINYLDGYHSECNRHVHIYNPQLYRSCDDEFVECMGLCKGYQTDWQSFITKFQTACDGVTSDKMVACITIALHPKFMRQYGYALRGVDLSPEAVFGEPFPISVGEMRQFVSDNRKSRSDNVFGATFSDCDQTDDLTQFIGK